MGVPKALLSIDREAFLERILLTCRSAELPVCVVLGDDHALIRASVDFAGAAVFINPHPCQGPLSSLQIALGFLCDSSAVIVHPVDHPLVSPPTIRGLAECHRRVPACILIPQYRGRKGHPALFPSRFYPCLREAPLEEGARWVVRHHPASTRLLPVEDAGILANLNRPGDLSYWRRATPASLDLPQQQSLL